MSIFKRLQPSEITITPFKAHKKFTPTIDNIDSSSGVVVTEGINYDDHFYTAEEKNSNGIYKRTVYHLVNKLHYKFEYDPAQTITNIYKDFQNISSLLTLYHMTVAQQ